MRTLSFDTSSGTLHLCVAEDTSIRYEKVFRPEGTERQEIAANLLPEIANALKATKISKNDLSLIVVGKGPGGFTGSRVGVVVAKTLAQAMRLPLMGISAFETIAWNVAVPTGIILSSAKGMYFVAGLHCAPKVSESVLIEPRCITLPELEQCLSGAPQWVVHPKALTSEGFSQETHFEPFPVINNTAVSQLQIAWNRLSLMNKTQSSVQDLAALFPWAKVEPMYLRGPSITLKSKNGNTCKTNEA